jgi:hypothetical protein
MYWKRFFTIGGWFTGLITAGLVLAAGAAVYAGSEQKKASKSAANQMRQGVQTFEPIAPNAPETVDWRRSALDALNFNINHQAQQQQFASQTNRFNTQQAQRMYRTFQPGFDSLQSQIGANALSFSRAASDALRPLVGSRVVLAKVRGAGEAARLWGTRCCAGLD